MLENKLVMGSGAMWEGTSPALQPLGDVPGEFWGGQSREGRWGQWVSSPGGSE